MYVEHASALFGKGSLVCITKKCRDAKAKAADTYNKTGTCDGLGGKEKAKCEKYKKKDNRKMGKLSEEAKKIVTEGGNCDSLKGKDKRTCKRAARLKARIISSASSAEGGECAGKSGSDRRKCQRMIKRDEKGKRGAFGFIGGKKANKQSQDNWNAFNSCKAELDKLKAADEISQADYDKILSAAEDDRKNKSQKIGRSKAFKASMIAAFGAIGSGKKIEAMKVCDQDAITAASNEYINKKPIALPIEEALISNVRVIKFAEDGKVAKGSTYVLTGSGKCKKLSKDEPWHESAHYNTIIECKKAAFQKRNIAGGDIESENESE